MTSKRTEGPSGVAQLGRYRLVSQIATGGMAEIFVARMDGYAGSNRLCVIKMIRPRIKTDPRAVQMFLDEARIAATLQHPNIVQMFEVGEMEGNYFIAMEYLHGEDMRTVIRRITREQFVLPLDHAIHIVIDLLAGLHYAHEKRGIDGEPLGIVHRDVSPHNLFVTYDGAVKIVDFGIAMATNREHQTKVETLKGKIQYMSPEQCRCIELDRRSDVYSAAIVLYELTTGRRLNKGDDEYEIMKRTVEGPLPRPSKVVDDYPLELENIVRMALAKQPDDRFQTALEMQQSLENFAHDYRLRRSNIELSKFMHRLFSDRIATWEQGVAQGTSIRELVEARHETVGETSGPTFDSMDEDAPSGRLITLSEDDEPNLDPVSGEIAEERFRPGPTTSELYPSIAVTDGYASAESTAPRLPKVMPKQVSTTDKVLSEPRGNSKRGRGRLLLILALVVLGTAGGVVAGLKLSSQSAATEPDAGDVLAAGGRHIQLADAGPDQSADAAAPVADAAIEPADAGQPDEPTPTELARVRLRATRGAVLYLNGRRRGSSPKTISGLKPGKYTYELRKRGYETITGRTTLQPGETKVIRQRLQKIEKPSVKDPPPEGAEGRLAIRSVPPGQIFVDGRSKVFLTDWSRKVPAGPHAVRVVIDKHGVAKTRNVTVPPGGTTKVICRLVDETFTCRVR